MPRIARPDAADKKSDKKPKHVRRLTPRECREVKAYWQETADWEKRPVDVKLSRKDHELPWNVAKTVTVEKLERRNPGRADGITWNADAFICAGQIEGDNYTEEVEQDWKLELENAGIDHQDHRPSISVSLVDMIRPAKPRRNKARAFEMAPTVSRTVVAEDDCSTTYSGWEDDLEYFEEEEWEQLFSPDESSEEERMAPVPVLPPRSYAQALRTER